MDSDVIADLKQFITATVSQQVSGLATKDDIAAIRGEMATGSGRLQRKMDDLQAAVAEALDTSNDVVDDHLKDHEKRITKLEQASAH